MKRSKLIKKLTLNYREFQLQYIFNCIMKHVPGNDVPCSSIVIMELLRTTPNFNLLRYRAYCPLFLALIKLSSIFFFEKLVYMVFRWSNCRCVMLTAFTQLRFVQAHKHILHNFDLRIYAVIQALTLASTRTFAVWQICHLNG